MNVLQTKPLRRSFGHQRRDSDIDTNYVGVIPAGQRIEGIEESVALPHFRIIRPNLA